MTSRIIQIGIFLSLLTHATSSLSQQKTFQSDTITHYVFRGNDTLSIRKKSNLISYFGKDGELLEKGYYNWSEQSRKWDQKTKTTYKYYPDEIVESYFMIVGQFERKQVDKKYKLTKNGKILSCDSHIDLGKELQLKDRWSYEYSKDTLRHVRYERNSTTFFKEREISLTYIKNEIISEEKLYAETQPGKFRVRKQYHNFKNGQSIKVILERFEDNKPDTIIYNQFNANNQLTSDTTKISYKLKDKHQSFLKSTQNYYNTAGQLIKKVIYYLNPDGSLDKNKENEMIVYTIHHNTDVAKKRPFEPSLE